MIPTAIPDQIITYAGAAVYFGGAALLFGQSLRGGAAPKPDLRKNALLRIYGASMPVISLVYLIAMLFGTPELQFAHRTLSAVLFAIVILSAARQGGMPAVSAETP